MNDYWVVGYSPQYVISLWMGYDDLDKGYNTNNVYRKKLWRYVANGVIDKNSKSSFPTSNDVVSVRIEKECFGDCLASEFTPDDMATTEYFKKGTAPSGVSDRFARLENVTNLQATQNNKTIELSWTPVAIPNAINPEYLKTYFDNLIKDQETHDNALNARLEYNNTKVGTIVYNVYLKNSSGELQFIGSTSDSKYVYNVTQNGNYTFVVKTSYTIFKDNASTGATSSVDVAFDVINVGLKGNSKIINPIGTPYTEQGIYVTRNGEDVTIQVAFTTVIRDSNSNVIQNIPSTNAGTYTVKYIFTYQNKNYELTRTVIYQ